MELSYTQFSHLIRRFPDFELSYETITIRAGDSLWTIALKYSKEDDIRKFIHKIIKANNMESSEIYVGTQLKIPV